MNVVSAWYQVSEQKGELIKSSSDAYHKLLEPLFNPLQEEFYVLPMVGQECVAAKLFIGGLSASSVDLKTMFRYLLNNYPNATSFLIAHNHPSGCIDPSDNDLVITKSIKEAALLLGYQFLDHIVFSNTGYYSFADKNQI
jgi:DNA repair protein RadC